MPVQIVAHRGWWKTPEEQNTLAAFARAFDAGIGVELDVRDWNGSLVVSHDPPVHDEELSGKFSPYFEEVIDFLGSRPNVLAVNVKSCGLAPWFAKIEPKPANWFFFDLIAPEVKAYLRLGLPCRYRESASEIIDGSALFANPNGIVLDDCDIVQRETHSNLCAISPEIHGRDHLPIWEAIRSAGPEYQISLITDKPAEAMEFFKCP